MTASGGTSSPGFETAFRLVGGHGRFQWLCLGVCALQLIMMTWNHMAYIFMGAVPKHWCHIQQLENSSWSLDQVKNISIPKLYSKASGEESNWKYDQCQYYAIDYQLLLEQSKGNFEVAYELVHPNHQGNANNNDDDENSSLPMPTTGIPPPPLALNTCQAWSYDNSIYTSTIVTEFDLVCGRRYLVASIQALYMIGAFSGTLIFGPLGDTILGRRKTVLIGIVSVIIGGFFSSFSTSYLMFVASRFLVAMGTAGTMQASGVWFLEHCDTKSRARMYCISALFFGVGYAIMPVYAYYIRTWSNLQLAFSLTTLSLLSFYWIFPESPRWLASHGRDEEAVKALERIAHFNKIVPKPERVDLLKCVRQCYLHSLDESTSGNNDNGEHSNAEVECKQSMLPTTTTTTGNNPQENGEHWKNKCTNSRVNKKQQKKIGILKRITSTVKNYSELVRTPQLRRISFVMWILFVAVAFIYYGFAFSSGNITTSPYLLVSLGALMEIPASVLPIPFLSGWGRRPTTVVCYLLTGLAALSIAVTPSSYEGVRTVLSMIGKLFVASAFTVLYFVVSESYPTVVRSTGQGAGTLMGRVGSISAPYVADMLTTVYPDLPSVIFGIVAIVAAFIALFIPEMKNVDMKDQLYELQQDSLKKSSGSKLQINHEETAA